MPRFNSLCKSTTCRYAIFGIAFGFFFPAVALFFDIVLNRGLNFTLSNFILIHIENPIHYIIDTAPIFLGIAFGVAGYYQEHTRILNRSLKQQADDMENSNSQLTKALDDFHAARDLLVKTEKLASLGQLTAGIAHEIKNPLNFITNFSESSLDLLEEMLSSSNEEERREIIEMLRGNFEKINQHGKRANNILQSMMMFARSGNIVKKLSDINQVSKDAADIAFHGMSSTIFGFKCDFQKNFDSGIPKINIMYEDISRVILNLLTNSFYSVHQRRLNEGDSFKANVTLKTGLIADPINPFENIILISVKDNGVGIPAKVQEKIFNPFFTTKPSGEGTGLGLSISQDIITVHGGKLSFKSIENNFTEFKIELPLNSPVEIERLNMVNSIPNYV